MKVWVKLLIGSALGLLLGFLLPNDNPAVSAVFSYLAQLALSAGRYIALPLIVFSLTIAIYELRQDGAFWPLVFRVMAVIVGTSLLVIGLGIAVTMFFPPERIPILIEQQAEQITLGTRLYFLEMFPSNMMSVLSSDGVYLLPVCVFAFFMAIGLSYDKNYTKPVLSIIDSLSRIFYHIAAFFSEILGVLIIILAAYWTIQYHTLMDAGIFKAITRLLLIFSLILAFIILPLLLYFVKKYKTPWKVLYASLGAAFASFFSGDINFSLPVLIQQSKENLGIRRRITVVSVMLWTTFGRAGSAMVAAISFIVILKSYSSLDIPAVNLFNIGLHAFLISLMLARNPGDGAFAALAVICSGYGHGFETGFLILKPMAFYLVSIGVFLDVMIASLGLFVIGRITGLQTERKIKEFI
ncbi:MAG: cation:dicarboxylase symporter family transporter [Spirochaetaceae bacterium]|jgi:Na+/H+-dicarboxylate symporter|nr:cation:dicarboxylase symporter family transporter [Spirochaetaceae bacterium]